MQPVNIDHVVIMEKENANEKTVQVLVEVFGVGPVEVDVSVPKDRWNSVVESLAEEVADEIEYFAYEIEDEDDSLDFGDSTGYIDTETGYCYDCTPEQALIAFHLQTGMRMEMILYNLSALETLRDALIKELETNHPELTKEIQRLKEITCPGCAMSEDGFYHDDNERCEQEQVCQIHSGYPTELLDDVANKIDKDLLTTEFKQK